MAVRVSSPILVGRSTELERLTAGLALAARRDGRHDRGRRGSRSRQDAAGRGLRRPARDDGALVLLGGCIDLHEGALPYGPIVEALRGLVRRSPGDELEALLGTNRSELARLVPDLGAVPDGTGSGLGIGSGQGRLFELLLGVLERLAGEAPVVFIVEDLHWSDRSTRDLLAFLVRNLRDAPVAGPVTYRIGRAASPPSAACRSWPSSTASGRVERLELGPFDRGDSAPQLRAIAGRDLDADARRVDPRPLRRQRLLRRGAARRRRRATASCPRPCATSCWPGSPSWPSRPRGCCGWPRPPASGSTRPARRGRRACDEADALRRAPRDASAARSWSPTRRRASATRSATRCSRRRSTTTCCPASGPGCTPAFARTLEAERGRRPVARGRARLPLVCRARPAARPRGRGRGRATPPSGAYAFPEALRPVRAGPRAVGSGPRRRDAGRARPDRAAARAAAASPASTTRPRGLADPGRDPARRRDRRPDAGRPAQRAPRPVRLDRRPGRGGERGATGRPSA